MDRKMLHDQWERLEGLLPGKATDCGVTAKDNRRFVEAVLWVMRTGSPWRDLPENSGIGTGPLSAFALAREGVWGARCDGAARDADMEHLFIDSTIVRAHQHSAGAQKQADRKSVVAGGLTTVACGSRCLGQPASDHSPAGQIADIEQATALIKDQSAEFIVATRATTDAFVTAISAQGSQAVIPPRSNRLHPRTFDRHIYKSRNLVERFFCRIKQFRRIATRYDKLAKSFLSFVHLACAFVWLT